MLVQVIQIPRVAILERKVFTGEAHYSLLLQWYLLDYAKVIALASKLLDNLNSPTLISCYVFSRVAKRFANLV